MILVFSKRVAVVAEATKVYGKFNRKPRPTKTLVSCTTILLDSQVG
jgi:hypothetical protein